MPDFWRLLWDQDVHTVIILDINVYQNGNRNQNGNHL